ncbi:LPXTG cell wall anchor domain-containing protein [Anaerocolumna sedimenticola]|jgi:LPXTG-motif cell wall-anchored protein|uniref:LPXTG cell wall anchor domain-containing protein n=1 Tax=Anaerocolumna sedimenticola TaxID=2696063 RepID=A0A6P1TR47_9FIRM|nr:LPXTG cell wall anchor domain-containing protein [Anaerocolumna sedimenticola]QHQ62817.1 LPXTG cell wall anchor domain-containing protein [Anaerocolumna sedimenticola]
MTEQGFEQSVENFADWAWQYELLIGGVIFIILLIAGFALLKKKKKNAGYICLGISLLVLISDVIKALLRVS